MRSKKNDDITWDVAGRIKSLEQFSGPALVRPRNEADAIPIHEPAPARVPRPRQSRIFLRGAEGFGAYADLTVTAPHLAD
ncbi:hypothetical protein L2K70_00190 [Nocardioides KLBMP 9356]|uniref:Uncharacterized protein n=1 Tax=Nocardioides potassii TaxID=2911371 RepID=A0ABS9H6S8_9ACTN|nr:hypothetical protein [Nocardioides potassii]MCF6376018.1 hypothetical protein [Nocardioides potassii]